MRKIVLLTLAGLLTAYTSSHAANYCGELRNHYGPLDYRKRGKVNLEIVEHAHFTEDVENGIKGSTGYLGADLDYTLRAIPNHHRALATLGKVAIREKTLVVPHTKYPVECYFERAKRFAPDDGVARAAYGNYLFAVGQTDKARAVFLDAVAIEPENATINYNLGLLELKAKDFDNANKHAQKAYALGFPLPGLKNKLIEAGKWDEKVEIKTTVNDERKDDVKADGKENQTE